MSTACSVSHPCRCYEAHHRDQSEADGAVWHYLAPGRDAESVDDDPGQVAAHDRGGSGHEGRHAEGLGDQPVQQSPLRTGYILGLGSGAAFAQLDVDW